MTVQQLAIALRAWRLIRRGTLQPAAAPAVLRPFLAAGLGPACDEIAAWARRSAGDPRSAQAAIRFFGLDRLPEDLRHIGALTAPSRPGGGRGIGPRQAEKLVSRAIADMAASGVRQDALPGSRPAPLRDPYPLPHEPSARRWASQVVVWGWAQVPADNRTATAALLYYEYEHALRGSAPEPSSRMERLRWRRLAWSVLQVAQHRARLAAAGPRYAALSVRPSAQLLAVSADDNGTAGLEALTAVCADPGRLADPEIATPALEFVRTAVREGRHEAPDLLGLLRGAATRRRTAGGSIPAMLESKLITLNAVMAREQRDPAGLAAARAGLRRIDELIAASPAFRDHETWVWHVESGYRTIQELADLYTCLGMFAQARAAADTLRGWLQRYGDPDPSYLPHGWHWNLLVTEASINRHIAQASHSPQWLRAAVIAAHRSAELRAAMELPGSWTIAAENEIIAVALDRLAAPAYRASREGSRLLEEVARRLRQLDNDSQEITDRRDLATRSALLRAKLLAWRLALLQADPAAVRAARRQVLQAVRSSAEPILPIEAAAIASYKTASAELTSG